MPLQAPELDTRKFEEIFREARLRIPRYTPEWTDFNESDPGITLLQLFAWLTEMMLYKLNQVPERNYIKFLQLLGLELRPAQPAVAHLTFSAKAGGPVDAVAAGTQVGAQSPAGDLLIFETDAGLDLVAVPLTDVQVYDTGDFSDVAKANATPGTGFFPFGPEPQLGAALYLGFTPPDPPGDARLFPPDMRVRVFLSEVAQAGVAQICGQLRTPPPPPVTLVWEFKHPAQPTRWRRLNVYEDSSGAFTREGDIVVEGPAEIAATIEGKQPEARYWLRVRLAEGSYPAGYAPRVDFLRFNTVQARNLSTIRGEVLGESDGVPKQTFRLSKWPVQPRSLRLAVQEGDTEQIWDQVDDFLSSTPADQHYVLNVNSGEIRFGDGQRGRIPVAGAAITAVEYRYGGGDAGNMRAGMISTVLTSLNGVEAVTNERAAEGGGNEQSVDDLRERAPALLRCRSRAVTADDFAAFAAEAGGVAKATALALTHPDHPGVDVPGAVTVVILPDRPAAAKGEPPKPSSDLIRQVCAYLDQFRLITTELLIKGPEYLKIRVEALVSVAPSASFDAVTRDVIEALDAYLSPATWKFGQNLHPTNLFKVIRDVKDVEAVDRLAVFVGVRAVEDLSRPIQVPPDGLVYGAEHEITVQPVEES